MARPRLPFPPSALDEALRLRRDDPRAKDPTVSRNLRMVILAHDPKWTNKRIGEAVELEVAQVNRILKQAREEGVKSLFGPSRHTQRPRARLTLAEEAGVIGRFIERAKVGGVLVITEVQLALEEATGRRYSQSAVYRMLKRHGWRKIKPRPRHPKADVAKQEEFKKTLPEALDEARSEAEAQGLEFRFMTQDEARFGRISDTSACWAPPGCRPVVPAQIIREYIYAFAAISPHDGAMVSLILPVVNAQVMSIFLAEVASRFPTSYILMLMDGAGWHRATNLVVPSNIKLLALPPYSPELNPTEHLWEELREKHFHNRVFRTLDAVEDQLIHALDTIEDEPARIASLAGFDWIVSL